MNFELSVLSGIILLSDRCLAVSYTSLQPSLLVLVSKAHTQNEPSPRISNASPETHFLNDNLFLAYIEFIGTTL